MDAFSFSWAKDNLGIREDYFRASQGSFNLQGCVDRPQPLLADIAIVPIQMPRHAARPQIESCHIAGCGFWKGAASVYGMGTKWWWIGSKGIHAIDSDSDLLFCQKYLFPILQSHDAFHRSMVNTVSVDEKLKCNVFWRFFTASVKKMFQFSWKHSVAIG